MFRYEKDMLPVIKESFKKRFKQEFFVEEFNTGIGIADIVFSERINKRDFYFNNFELLYHTVTLFSRKNKKITDFDLHTRFPKKQMCNLIEKFIILNLIEVGNTNTFYVKNKLNPTINEFVAIEAKLKDWKSGFYQAMRYRNFAHKSYLALSYQFIHRVDKQLLIDNNIGLLSVSPDSTRIVISPSKKKPNDEIAFYYSGETFTKKVFIDQKTEKYCPQQWL